MNTEKICAKMHIKAQDANKRRAEYENRKTGTSVSPTLESSQKLSQKQNETIHKKVTEKCIELAESCGAEKQRQEKLALALSTELLHMPTMRPKWGQTKTNELKKMWLVMRAACMNVMARLTITKFLSSWIHMQWDKTSLDLATYKRKKMVAVDQDSDIVIKEQSSWSKERGKSTLSIVTQFCWASPSRAKVNTSDISAVTLLSPTLEFQVDIDFSVRRFECVWGLFFFTMPDFKVSRKLF